MREVRRAAEALTAHVKKTSDFLSRPVEQAIVQTIDPLSAELLSGGLVLDDGQLVLGTWARKYDQDHGIEVGDTLTVVEVAGDDYVVLEVHGEKEVLRGVGTVAAAGTTKALSVTGGGGGTVNMAVAHWLEAFDADGNSIGWVPVFASKT